MEFSSLKEQRHQAHDAAEARAAAAAASVDADDSPRQPGSSSSRTTQSTSGANGSRSGTADPVSESPFGKAMADPDRAQPERIHSQPLEDGSLPQPDHPEGAQSARASTDATAVGAEAEAEAEEPPMRPHNLLTATEILQGAPGSASPFAPAPILRLNAIRISGAGRALRPSFLASLCRPYLDPTLSTQNADVLPLNTLYYGSRTSHVLPGQPTTLASVLALTSSLAGDLDKLDVFRNIEASLAPSVFPGASEEDVDVILACGRPKGRVFLKSSTDVGNGEGSASVQGRIRNVFGGAETLQGSATFGTRTRQAFNVEFGAPLAGNPDMSYRLAAFSHDRDLSAFASVSEAIRGVRASINSSSTLEPQGVINPTGAEEDEGVATTQHEFAYEASLRELARVRPYASVAVRKMAAAPSVKSALIWTWLRDSRDSVVLPSRGSRMRTLLEYAGLGGDANHVKAEFEASTGRHFSPLAWLFPSTASSAEVPTSLMESAAVGKEEGEVVGEVAQGLHPIFTTLTLRTGVVHALGSSAPHLSDRFQLGGPTSVRMFRHSSLGPKNGQDSLGGDAFWSVGLSMFSPIPKKPHWPLMLHAFANAGQLAQLPTAAASSRVGACKELAQPSTAAGVGLVYTQGQLRVELNAGVPLTARRGDGMAKGLQLGIGIDFL